MRCGWKSEECAEAGTGRRFDPCSVTRLFPFMYSWINRRSCARKMQAHVVVGNRYSSRISQFLVSLLPPRIIFHHLPMIRRAGAWYTYCCLVECVLRICTGVDDRRRGAHSMQWRFQECSDKHLTLSSFRVVIGMPIASHC